MSKIDKWPGQPPRREITAAKARKRDLEVLLALPQAELLQIKINQINGLQLYNQRDSLTNSSSWVLESAPTLVACASPSLNTINVGMPRMPYF